MRMSMRSRRTITAGMAVAIASVGLFSSACAPAPSTKVISGTIKGADGHVVDVMLGFDVLDARGNKIDLGFIKAGYSSIQRLNYCVPASGETAVRTCPASGQGTGHATGPQATTYKWSLRVPSNAVSVYVEAYPKSQSTWYWEPGYRGYTGPTPGNDNLSNYGMSHRRNIQLPTSISGVPIVLPNVCDVGGTTGSLAGHINRWPGGVGSIYTWSMANDQPTLGFGIGVVDANGNYTITGLQSGQTYRVQAQTAGFSRSAISSGNVSKCQTKSFNF
jgi:hypothetical protein